MRAPINQSTPCGCVGNSDGGKGREGGSPGRTAAFIVVAVFRAVLGVTLQDAGQTAVAAPKPETAPTPKLGADAVLEPLAAAAAASQTPSGKSKKAAGTGQSREGYCRNSVLALSFVTLWMGEGARAAMPSQICPACQHADASFVNP